MAFYIVLRESNINDMPGITDTVRKAYVSNAGGAWCTALFHEATLQAIVLLAAFMFIFIGVPLSYCMLSVPIVLILLYAYIYSALYMKAVELVCNRVPLICWVAEAYEPYFCKNSPQRSLYRIVPEDKLADEGMDGRNYRKKIIGTCAITKHKALEDVAWLFRLAVDESYRKKNIGLMLVQTAQNWCRSTQFNFIELVVTECQSEARQLFAHAGFDIRQMYHRKLCTSLFTMQMFQLRCEVRPTFT